MVSGSLYGVVLGSILAFKLTQGRAVGLTTLVNFGYNVVVALAFAPLQDLVGESNTFIIFGIVSIILLEFIITTVPKTKGLNLGQIEVTMGVILTPILSLSPIL